MTAVCAGSADEHPDDAGRPVPPTIGPARTDRRLDNGPPIDTIYSVNVVQFWPYPDRTLAELRRLLKPRGLIASTFMHRLGEDRLGQARTRARALEMTMRTSGFERIETRWLALRSAPAFCVVARTWRKSTGAAAEPGQRLLE